MTLKMMGKTPVNDYCMVCIGSKGVAKVGAPLYGRMINDDGSLGKEFRVPTGALFEVTYIDYYRHGVIVNSTNVLKSFFVPFNERLFTALLPNENISVAVNAIYVYKVGRNFDLIELGFLLKLLLITLFVFTTGILFGLSVH